MASASYNVVDKANRVFESNVVLPIRNLRIEVATQFLANTFPETKCYFNCRNAMEL